MLYLRGKDSCKAAQGKCSFPWDGIGLAHKRQLRFHRAVCKTAISPERCIIAPFILKGAERCGFRAGRESSLQAPAQLPADGTQFSAAHHLIVGEFFRRNQKTFQHSGTGTQPMHTGLAGQLRYLVFQNFLPVLVVAQLLFCFGFLAAEIGEIGFRLGQWHHAPFQKLVVFDIFIGSWYTTHNQCE